MGQPTDKINKVQEKQEPVNEFIRQADRAASAFANEVQKDWQSSCKWVKEHPRETGMVVGGAMIVGGVALCIKDAKDGERVIAAGNKIRAGEQVVQEVSSFEKSGSVGQLSTHIKFGNNTESNYLIDPASGAGRRLLEQRDGLKSFLPKER